MHFSTRLPILCLGAIALTIATGDVADAHNLFVLVERQADGPDLVDVIFEHAPYPGKGVYNQPLLDRGRTWIQRPGQDTDTPLRLQEVTRLGKKFLQTATAGQGPRAIVHSCEWGVYKGRLDYFHGKYLDVSSADQVSRLAQAPKLPLDIVAAIQADGLAVTIVFENKPLANATVWMWTPGGKEAKRTTNAQGKIVLDKPAPGLHSFAAIHLLDGPTGEFQGQPYRGIMHGTTCSLRWPVK